MPGSPFNIPEILAWADAWHAQNQRWPKYDDGPIPGTQETWRRVDNALIYGLRGLKVGSSLAKLLMQHRGIRHRHLLPALTIRGILAWADAHHQSTGKWPIADSGPVIDAPGEVWANIDMALREGGRKLPGGSSLAQLLSQKRGVLNRLEVPRLSLKKILRWADRHHERTGHWPNRQSGPVLDAPGETWLKVESALAAGCRGLQAKSSLAQMLAKHWGVRNKADLPRLTIAQILRWADAHKQRTGH